MYYLITCAVANIFTFAMNRTINALKSYGEEPSGVLTASYTISEIAMIIFFILGFFFMPSWWMPIFFSLIFPGVVGGILNRWFGADNLAIVGTVAAPLCAIASYILLFM